MSELKFRNDVIERLDKLIELGRVPVTVDIAHYDPIVPDDNITHFEASPREEDAQPVTTFQSNSARITALDDRLIAQANLHGDRLDALESRLDDFMRNRGPVEEVARYAVDDGIMKRDKRGLWVRWGDIERYIK